MFRRLSVPRSTSFAAGEGSLITISFRPIPFFPLRLKWDAFITEFRWNDFFCDEQRRGPFNIFATAVAPSSKPRRNSGTVVSDDVEYELPFGLLGDVANAW